MADREGDDTAQVARAKGATENRRQSVDEDEVQATGKEAAFKVDLQVAEGESRAEGDSLEELVVVIDSFGRERKVRKDEAEALKKPRSRSRSPRYEKGYTRRDRSDRWGGKDRDRGDRRSDRRRSPSRRRSRSRDGINNKRGRNARSRSRDQDRNGPPCKQEEDRPQGRAQEGERRRRASRWGPASPSKELSGALSGGMGVQQSGMNDISSAGKMSAGRGRGRPVPAWMKNPRPAELALHACHVTPEPVAKDQNQRPTIQPPPSGHPRAPSLGSRTGNVLCENETSAFSGGSGGDSGRPPPMTSNPHHHFGHPPLQHRAFPCYPAPQGGPPLPAPPQQPYTPTANVSGGVGYAAQHVLTGFVPLPTPGQLAPLSKQRAQPCLSDPPVPNSQHITGNVSHFDDLTLAKQPSLSVPAPPPPQSNPVQALREDQRAKDTSQPVTTLNHDLLRLLVDQAGSSGGAGNTAPDITPRSATATQPASAPVKVARLDEEKIAPLMEKGKRLLKDQIANFVKIRLKPHFKRKKITRDRFKELARECTETAEAGLREPLRQSLLRRTACSSKELVHLCTDIFVKHKPRIDAALNDMLES